MKIETPNHLDIEDIAGEFESKQAGIDESSLPFILTMLSTNFYSNPIGSVVREITSNCFDSHAEAKVDDAVLIKIDDDEEGYYISFNDYGVGLSPERIDKVYMTYFTSTKRHTDDMIGGFGLGSKTPLAYTDVFYINTNYNGIKYNYVFSKGAKLPTLDLLSQSETTDRNGTEIRIYIKGGYGSQDWHLFKKEMGKQLAYFDNVIFQNCDIDNDYKIYEGNYFKFRNTDHYSDEMHICFGKVAYPIDWTLIGMKEIKVSVGVKFEIGELIVTPNRESLRYTPEIVKLVTERIKLVREELIAIFNEQNKDYTDFATWWKVRKQNKHITFGEDDTLGLTGFTELSKNFEFLPFKEIGIELQDSDPLSCIYTSEKSLSSRKIVKTRYINNLTDIFVNSSSSLLYSNNSNYSGLKNYYHHSGIIINRRNIKQIFRNLKTPFKVYQFDKNGYRIEDSSYFNLGVAIKAYKLIKFFTNLVESTVNNYNCEIPIEEIEGYKEYQKENDNAIRRKLNQTVLVNGVSFYGDKEWKVSDIDRDKGIIVYGHREDTTMLTKAIAFMYLIPTFRENEEDGYINYKVCKIIRIAKNNVKYFKNKSNMIHVKELYGDNKLFRKLASSYRIEMILGEYLKNQSGFHCSTFFSNMKEINSEIGNLLVELHNYHQLYTTKSSIRYTNTDRSDLKREIIEIATKYNLFDITMESKIKTIENYFNGIELLKYVELNSETLPVILKYLREKKKKLNLDYYRKVVEPETIPVQMTLVIDDDYNLVEPVIEIKEEPTKFLKLTA